MQRCVIAVTAPLVRAFSAAWAALSLRGWWHFSGTSLWQWLFHEPTIAPSQERDQKTGRGWGRSEKTIIRWTVFKTGVNISLSHFYTDIGLCDAMSSGGDLGKSMIIGCLSTIQKSRFCFFLTKPVKTNKNAPHIFISFFYLAFLVLVVRTILNIPTLNSWNCEIGPGFRRKVAQGKPG